MTVGFLRESKRSPSLIKHLLRVDSVDSAYVPVCGATQIPCIFYHSVFDMADAVAEAPSR